jgi:FkbM family methyltransferase
MRVQSKDDNCRATTMKALLKRAINMIGYDLRKYKGADRRDLADFLNSRHVDLVFDVGANVGQFASMLRRCGYRGEIVSFEPIRSVFLKLQDAMSKDQKWHGYNIALGDKATTTVINVSRNSVFSSIQPQTAAAQAFDPEAATARVEPVQIDTLDTIAARHNFSRAFLKVDTQGYEQQVLTGGRATLEKVVGMQLELPIVHLYENVWQFSTACKAMESLGFVPSIILPVNYDRGDNFSLLEVDCVFRSTSLSPNAALND